MRHLISSCLAGLVFCALTRLTAADIPVKCAVTAAPIPRFIPGAGYSSYAGENSFLYGTNSLWTVVMNPGAWKLGRDGTKLPYFRQGYDYMKEQAPLLTVVARRMDAAAPLVFADGASGGMAKGKDPSGMFMVTGIAIPAAGCWELSAHYRSQTLTYVVRVEP